MKYYDKLIFELSKPGRSGYSLPECEFPVSDVAVPQALARESELPLPQVSEVDVVRHYTKSVADEFRCRYRILSARQLYHEVQS